MSARIERGKAQTGRMLLEVIISLAIFAVFGMFIIYKQLARYAEIEEINFADGIKVLTASLQRYLEANRMNFENGDVTVGNLSIPRIEDWTADEKLFLTLDDPELRRFMPDGFDRDRRYFSSYRIAVKRIKRTGADAPKRVGISAVILSGDKIGQGRDLNNMRAARISSMLGSGGGYLRKIEDEPDATIATGTQGFWQLDMNDYFTKADNVSPVRVISALNFSATMDDDYRDKVLFRYRNIAGVDDPNTMHTSLNMGGNDIINLNKLKFGVPDPADPTGETYIDTLIIDGDKGTLTVNPAYMKMKNLYDHAKGASRSTADGSRVAAGGIAGDHAYGTDFAGTSVWHDVQVEALGNVRLSELLKFSQQNALRVAIPGFVPAPGYATASGARTADPTCPAGFAPVIRVYPIDVDADAEITSQGRFYNIPGIINVEKDVTLKGNTVMSGNISSKGKAEKFTGGSMNSSSAASGGKLTFNKTTFDVSGNVTCTTSSCQATGSHTTGGTTTVASTSALEATDITTEGTANLLGTTTVANPNVTMSGSTSVSGSTTDPIMGTGKFNTSVTVSPVNIPLTVAVPNASGTLTATSNVVQTVGWNLTSQGYSAVQANVFCQLDSGSF
jgi:hypothetical protein